MSYILDSFKTEQDARSFMRRVKELHPEIDCQLFMDAREAHNHDVFPWVQIPPVVHVDRMEHGDEDLALGAELEELVEDFTGVYAGT